MDVSIQEQAAGFGSLFSIIKEDFPSFLVPEESNMKDL
jgi:hypothetical protein